LAAAAKTPDAITNCAWQKFMNFVIANLNLCSVRAQVMKTLSIFGALALLLLAPSAHAQSNPETVCFPAYSMTVDTNGETMHPAMPSKQDGTALAAGLTNTGMKVVFWAWGDSVPTTLNGTPLPPGQSVYVNMPEAALSATTAGGSSTLQLFVFTGVAR
jgi:hypothetical protein